MMPEWFMVIVYALAGVGLIEVKDQLVKPWLASWRQARGPR